jgi:GH24 family phage-related lysozyme (muramidase)
MKNLLTTILFVVVSCITLGYSPVIKTADILVASCPEAVITAKDFNKLKETEIYKTAFELMLREESLRLRAYWDINRYSIGYGTISYRGERITFAEAIRRAEKEFLRVIVNLYEKYPHLDDQTLVGLAILDYNIGEIGYNLNRAIEDHDKRRIAYWMKQYFNDANGNKLKVLVERRKMEARFILADSTQVAALYKEAKEHNFETIVVQTRDSMLAIKYYEMKNSTKLIEEKQQELFAQAKEASYIVPQLNTLPIKIINVEEVTRSGGTVWPIYKDEEGNTLEITLTTDENEVRPSKCNSTNWHKLFPTGLMPIYQMVD